MDKKTKTFFLKYRRIFVVVVHLCFICLAYGLAFLIRFDFSLPEAYASVLINGLPVLIITKMVALLYFDLFRGLWRYAGMADLVQIIKASVMATAFFVIMTVFLFGSLVIPRTVFLIDFILFVFLVGGVRLLTRFLREKYRHAGVARKQTRVLIVGAGETGLLTLKHFQNNPSMGVVVGFIDDDKAKRNTAIQGVKIFGGRHHIADVVDTLCVEEIILAMPSAQGESIRSILSGCDFPDVKIKIMPALEKIIDGELEVRPRQVKLDDLLGREPVAIDQQNVEAYIKDKRVLITGAGGSIGSELCRQITQYGPEKIILFDHNENDVYFLEVEFKTKFPQIKFRTIIGDIRDIGLLRHVFKTYAPHVVFHAAAHKHVPLMEANPIAAVHNNVVGTRNMIYAAAHYHVDRFVLISTDKAVNPTSIMGATKRLAEMLLQAKGKGSKTKFMAVRFGNVIGSAGSVIPLFKKQIEEGGPVTVTHPDVKRYFMSIPEAAALVLQTGSMGEGGEIFILDMGEQIRIVDLARNLIALSGLVVDKDIAIKFTGLRPGEKLYEEILHDEEHDRVTKHNKIYISSSEDFDPVILRGKIREMCRYAKLAQDKKVVELIGELVPIQKSSGGA